MLLDNLEDVLAEQDQMICRGMLIMIAAPIELLMQLQQCCI